MRIAQEPLFACQPDIEAVAREQWLETGDPELPPAPNWELYYALEQAKALIVLVGRTSTASAVGHGAEEAPGGGSLEAYMAIMVHRHVNAKAVPAATISTYYVRPCSSRGIRLNALFQAAVATLKAMGVRRVTAETEYGHSCGRLLKLMGFAPQKIGYIMRLDP